MWSLLLFLCSSGVQVLASPHLRAPSSCGYESCPKPKDGFINIHLVPHTHDDVGWLKTLDQYYYGSKNNIQDAGVQYILDSVVQELLHDPRKRFIYVETAFFWKWWKEQSDILRHQVKKLVNRGQLEFIGGAWSMHDEAATHYQSIIDQFSWGFRRLGDAFGVCGRPRVGWQIDPFGHSRESASIMARLGFDGLFLGRIDWEDKMYRMKNKTAEMVWFTSANDNSDASRLFTGVLYNTYSAPRGFCFDINCHDEPIIDNKKSPLYNAKERAEEFLDIMKNYSKAYRTNNILVTMGDDFMYMDAHMYFKNMDKLIRTINFLQDQGSKFHAFYSTPSCYLKAVNDAKVTLPVKHDDFMPYSSDPMAFWTGYFTSRPTIKYFERKGNNYLQVCKQLYALSELGPEDRGDLIEMREAMGVMQHHDAVTGTEKQHVAADYSRILTRGFSECDIISQAAFNKLMPKAERRLTVDNCLLLNISSCPLTETEDSFVVTIYNPLSRTVSRPVRLPVKSSSSSYSVLCPKGKEQPNQVVELPDSLLNIPGRKSSAQAELVFIAKELPPLGFRSYYIKKSGKTNLHTSEVPISGEKTTVGHDKGASVSVDSEGRLVAVRLSGKDSPLSQSFYYYNSAVGNNEVFENRSSGAYIFRPNGSEVIINEKPQTKFYQGPVVSEVHQTFSSWVSQVIRVYNGFDSIEFDWLVGPIPISGNGKEIITRFNQPEIKNKGVFFTDSNGREFLQRKLNYRPSWPVELSEKIPGNYYPVTAAIGIADSSSDSRVTVVTDRAQGGSSLADGQIELMVHRRLTHDDAFGVGEALNETAFGEGLVARGTHIVTAAGLGKVRHIMQEAVLGTWTFVSPTSGMSFQDWTNSFHMEFSGLSAELPQNVQMLTLEPWSGSSLLLRLEHVMETTDDPVWSKPARVNLQDIFSGWKIKSVEETMLGANQKVGEVKRLLWRTEEGDAHFQELNSDRLRGGLPELSLSPMQIRTFIIEVANKKSTPL